MNKKFLLIIIFSAACFIFRMSAHSQEDMQLVGYSLLVI